MAFASIPEALDEVRQGRFVILVDDENRENEGDLVLAADRVTPEAINFMITHARGLVCLSLTKERVGRLRLPMQAEHNTSRHATAFTVSIDARTGITTGISAQDRARTVRVATAEDARPEDLSRPGHVFPLEAKEGGVLVRAGHTEGSVDLARLAGLTPAAVICEVLNEDGTMARRPDLEAFAGEHDLAICSIADLIDHRRRHETHVECVARTTLPTDHGPFDLLCYRSSWDEKVHVALIRGDIGQEPGDGPADPDPEPTLVRVHSECLTGDVFGSNRCDCGSQLRAAMAQIAEAGRGVLLYMRQEGRGIGLENKIRAYELQDEGFDTVEANALLGFPADLRDYGVGAQILRHLGRKNLRLLTNNPRKVVGLEGYGLQIVDRVPLRVPASDESRRYLETKRDKLGHHLPDDV